MAFDRKIGYVIGIDPDAKLSGLSVFNRQTRVMEIFCLNFPALLEKVKGIYEENKEAPFMVYVEAGWMNKGNWHITESRNGKFSPSAWAAAVGTATGACNAVSKNLLECFEFYGIPCSPIKPLRKCWHGPDRKITHKELIHELNIYRVKYNFNRSNQEERDAALICLVNI